MDPRDAPGARPSAPSQDVRSGAYLVSLAMGLVLLLVWVIRACHPEEEYLWNITYRELLVRDEGTHDHL